MLRLGLVYMFFNGLRILAEDRAGFRRSNFHRQQHDQFFDGGIGNAEDIFMQAAEFVIVRGDFVPIVEMRLQQRRGTARCEAETRMQQFRQPAIAGRLPLADRLQHGGDEQPGQLIAQLHPSLAHIETLVAAGAFVHFPQRIGEHDVDTAQEGERRGAESPVVNAGYS